MAAAEFAPASPAFRADPWPAYRALRALDPVLYRPQHDDWIVTGHAEVRAVLAARDRLAAAAVTAEDRAAAGAARPPQEPRREAGARVEDGEIEAMHARLARLESASLLNRSPPAHTRLRRAVGQPIHALDMTALRGRVDALAGAIIDRHRQHGRLDIVADYAFPITVTVICDLLGLPVEDAARFAAWSRDSLAARELVRDRRVALRARMARQSLADYLNQRLRDGRAARRSPLVAALQQREADGAISQDELLGNVMSLLLGGFENTQNAIALACLALARDPASFDRLRREPDGVAVAVDEFLRFEGPVQCLYFTASAPAEVAGRRIAAGQRVHLVIGAANRDPRRFPEADVLVVDRAPNPHLSFGSGMHYCLGAAISRLEIEVAVATLLRRLPDLAISAQAEYTDNYVFRGVRRLEATF